jgi:hypothetical protein
MLEHNMLLTEFNALTNSSCEIWRIRHIVSSPLPTGRPPSSKTRRRRLRPSAAAATLSGALTVARTSRGEPARVGPGGPGGQGPKLLAAASAPQAPP